MSRAITYVVGNSKGGVSKSTSVQNIGVVLSNLGYNVLCVDVDNQSHLSVSCGQESPELLPLTLTDLIERAINNEQITKELVQQAIVKTNTFDLLPSTFLLDRLEIALNTINGREFILGDILETVKDSYDMIFLDCNSSRNVFTINALSCADYLIIPSQCQYLSTGGIGLMLSTLQTIKKRINPSIQFKGILLTMYQSNTNQSKNTVSAVRDEYQDKVFKTLIPYSIKVADSQKLGTSIIQYDKNNPVSLAYQEFVEKELLVNE